MPASLRPSDQDRREAIAELQRGYVAGQLSTSTLEARVEAAELARSRAALDALLRDLLGADAEPRPTVWTTLLLSSSARSRVVVGRHSSCDVVLHAAGVSRRHAAFDREDDGWWVTDLGSTNGTRVGGRDVRRAEVRPGDTCWLGDARVELS